MNQQIISIDLSWIPYYWEILTLRGALKSLYFKYGGGMWSMSTLSGSGNKSKDTNPLKHYYLYSEMSWTISKKGGLESIPIP